MIFVSGGSFSGKEDFVFEKFDLKNKAVCSGKDVLLEDIFSFDVIFEFQELIRRFYDVPDLEKILTEKTNFEIIVCDEVGLGIVPVLKKERDFRELVGRIGCYIAQNADTVVYVTMGIPKVIKGKLL